MATTYHPWQIAPTLQLHRLQVVAQIFVKVWAELSELHQPSKGDTPWSLGCRGYSRTCHRISRAALGEHGHWLRVLHDTGLSYLFAIGQVPFKFLRGKPNRTVVRHRVCSDAESRARQGVLDFLPEPELGLLLPRFVIETDGLWRARDVSIVWVDEKGKPHHPYSIPLEAATITSPAPTTLRAPVLGFSRDRKNKKDTQENE